MTLYRTQGRADENFSDTNKRLKTNKNMQRYCTNTNKGLKQIKRCNVNAQTQTNDENKQKDAMLRHKQRAENKQKDVMLRHKRKQMMKIN